MNVYQEITLLPAPDIGHFFLWEKVFQQIHLALVEGQNTEGQVPVGLGFPEYSAEPPQLGTKLRIFAPNEAVLEALDIKKWLAHFSDYVHITRIRAVPTARIEGFARYKRLQPKSNLERIARRKAKRENISVEQALKVLKSKKARSKRVNNPFIQIKSLSSQRSFRIFIEKERVSEQQSGLFSTYGLSVNQSTLPEF